MYIVTLFLQDVPDEDIKKEVQSQRKEPPKLVVFTDHHRLKSSFVVADGVTIMSKMGSTATDAILLLIAVYYLFDLEYPKTYSQLLGHSKTMLLRVFPMMAKRV